MEYCQKLMHAGLLHLMPYTSPWGGLSLYDTNLEYITGTSTGSRKEKLERSISHSS